MDKRLSLEDRCYSFVFVYLVIFCLRSSCRSSGGSNRHFAQFPDNYDFPAVVGVGGGLHEIIPVFV